MVITMFEALRVFNLAESINYRSQQIVSKRIFQDDEVTFYIFSYDEGESVSEQSNSEDIFIFVLEGEVQVKMQDICKARGGEILAIKSGTLHQVKANEKSKVLQLSLKIKGDEEMGKFISKIGEQKVIRLIDEIDYENEGVSSKSLTQRESFTLTLMAFSKNSKIASHSSTGDALVQVLEGTARIVVGDEEFTVSQGESILMPAQMPHALYGVTEFKMLLTVAKP